MAILASRTGEECGSCGGFMLPDSPASDQPARRHDNAAQGADCFAAMISNLEALYRAYEARDRYIANAANGKAEAETADIYCDDTLKCRKQLKPQSVTWSSRRHRALALLTTQRASGCL
jgi:hypothetical protein